MRVLVGCESSGEVRRAFKARGHDAWSCDLLEADDNSSHHIVGDVVNAIEMYHWDLLIAHPPCTRLCNSGSRWLKIPPAGKTLEQIWRELEEGVALFNAVWRCDIEKICVENPVMHKHARFRIKDYQQPQYIQPWQFGHPETKKTGLWLKNLPPLFPTNVVSGREQKVHKMSPGPDRWKQRSKTYAGIAEAMAARWG
jgi:hypothetical protein